MMRNQHVLFLILSLLLAGCRSGYQGMSCDGTMSSLEGQTLGQSQAYIIDRITSFTVSGDDIVIESGTLHSTDRQRYIPASVTREGYLAQRIAGDKFRIASAAENRMITWVCPQPQGK